jgi:hypothetical protein
MQMLDNAKIMEKCAKSSGKKVRLATLSNSQLTSCQSKTADFCLCLNMEFSKANSNNLPAVDIFALTAFFSKSANYSGTAEYRHKKLQR